jgi:hypothetical protein
VMQYSGDLNVYRSSDHQGGTVLHVGSATINLLGVSPDEALRVNGAMVGPVRHDHHDDLLF